MRATAPTFSLLLFASLVASAATVENVNAQAGPVATTKVDIYGNAFSPPDIIVLKGTKVTWTNKDSVFHTVTSNSGPETIEDPYAPTGSPAGTSGDHTFNTVGTTTYYCRVHTSMAGSVKVVEKFDSVQVPIVEVEADDENQFTPKFVSLNVSQGINWTNPGTSLHDVTFEDPAIGSLGDLKPGGRLSLNFTKEGTYAYRCKYHARDFQAGMVGRVAVGGNTTLPVILVITEPQHGDNVTGAVEVQGTLEKGSSGTQIDAVQISFDDGPWFNASGIERWNYTWNTTDVPPGNHTIRVQALSDDLTLANATTTVMVDRAPAAPPAGNDTPLPGVAIAVAALGAASLRRRRDGRQH